MRSILITGCSSGIGETCAKRLKEDGWRVFATVRNETDRKRLEDEGLETFILDYTDNQSIHDTFNQVMDKTGGTLDALFNNGAYGQPGAVEDLSTDALREQFEANFFGWHELTNLCMPVMRKQGHGRIVHCSSILGWIASPWRGAYVASKFALEGLASTMRQELHGTHIHVSLIEPGPIATKFSENALQKFYANIDWQNSVNHPTYLNEIKRLTKDRDNGITKYVMPPDAVYDKLRHALTAKQPKAHYGVTIPTHFMNIARRIVPTRLLDKLILKNA